MHCNQEVRRIEQQCSQSRDYRNFCTKNCLPFRDFALLETAFTHRSYAHESTDSLDDNERLEFLGDSVLGLCISEHLFLRYPDRPEGYLAKIKSTAVSARILARLARELNLGTMILLGKGERQNGGCERDSILADCMEAVIGALYLDRGLKTVRAFITDQFEPVIEQVSNGELRFTYRTDLQELVQKHFQCSPEYVLLEEEGPSNDKNFTMEVQICGHYFGQGESSTKKEARQNAAREALQKLKTMLANDTLPEELASIKAMKDG